MGQDAAIPRGDRVMKDDRIVSELDWGGADYFVSEILGN
jgi:hypothetical protein